MGYQLYRHVLNHAPADLTKEERLLLLVIADDANEKTRLGSPGQGLLEHRTGMDPQAIKRALRKLASRGLEIRIPIAKKENGDPIYAVRGRRSTYRVPVFPPRLDHPLGVTSEPHSEMNGGHLSPEWGSSVNGMGVTSDPPSPHSPHTPPPADPEPPHENPTPAKKKTTKRTKTTETNPIDFVMDTTGATETEAAAILARLQADNQIKTMSGFLKHIAANGDLQAAADAHRATRRPRRTELCDEHTRPIDRCPFCAVQKEAS